MAKTPAVGKKAAKTPKKAGKSTKRTKRVESYRCVEKLARKVAKCGSLFRGSSHRPPIIALVGSSSLLQGSGDGRRVVVGRPLYLFFV